MEDIGDAIRYYREINKLTQKELANKLSISPSTIGMYEQNRRTPDIQTLASMSKIFGVSTDYLLGLSKSRTGENDCSTYFYENGEANYSIRQIAEMKGISYEEILEKSCIEKERFNSIWFGSSQPVAEELIRLSHVLNVSIDYMLDNSRREKITSDEEIILRYYHHDEESIMMLLESFCALNKKERTIILGKCLEMEQDGSVAADQSERKASGK